MPIALERRSEIGRSSFNHSSGCAPIFEPPEIAGEALKMTLPPPPAAAAAEVEESSACTSSSSSIGKNSESLNASDGEDLAGEKEVESAYKGSPLGALESLEEALPMRRGISNFYNGKSKSFASLSDVIVSCASVKDLGKQENAYTRKRRNLLASKNFSLKSSSTLKSNGGGIHKRPPSSSRSTLALAVVMNNDNHTGEEEQQDQKHRLLPPLHPSVKSSTSASSQIRSSSPQYCSFPLRSFSLTDLQGLSGSGPSIGLQDERKSFY